MTERIGLDGQPLAPLLPTAAGLWKVGDISLRHVEVLAGLLDSPEVRRVPHLAEGVEKQLATEAPLYTPYELRDWGLKLIRLDQDGPEPDDDDEPRQPNELHLSPLHTGGGRVRGLLDAFTYDALMTSLGGVVTPPKRGDDDPRTLAERRADGLGQLAMFALTHDDSLATTGGARPHLNVIMTLAELEGRVREATLDFGGRLHPAHLRALACDCGVIPVVLGSNSEPLDIGRKSRNIPLPIRRAVTGIVDVPSQERVSSRELVMVCIVHHHMLHEKSGWTVEIVHGHPEFTPPAWIDPRRTPRRNLARRSARGPEAGEPKVS